MVFKEGAYQWCVKKEGVLWFGIWGARLESGTDFDFLDRINKWHHTVITFEGKSKEAREEVSTELALAGIAAGSPADVETELIKYPEAVVNTIRIEPDGETVNERLYTLEEVMAIINRI